MSLIYTPSGKAREYSPLALNVYNGCDHGCSYCYTRLIKGIPDAVNIVKERNNLVCNLGKELAKTNHKEQILLSFMCDPYSKADISLSTTRETLSLLLKHGRSVAVLTKGGKRCLRDLDIFKAFGRSFKIGATLTLFDTKEVEPNAATTSERLETLEILYMNNIMTWVSIEPVIDPKESLQLIKTTIPYVHHFKVGKMNHFEKKFSPGIDWTSFLYSSVDLLRSSNTPFYIKHDLQAFDIDNILTPIEKDMDALNVSC